MKSFFRHAAVATALACGLSAVAGEFTITPVRIFMSPRDRAIAVTVSNDSQQDVVMQADLYAWKQREDGSDELQPSEDLFLTPPVIKLGPGARQVVRLARLAPASGGVQQTYRLVVRELPEARATGQLQLQVALAFSLPVFVSPPGVKRDLRCTLERGAGGRPRAVCSNAGTAYAQIRAFELLDPRGVKVAGRETGGYLLASVRRGFDLETEGGAAVPGGPMKLQAALDDGSLQVFDATLPN